MCYSVYHKIPTPGPTALKKSKVIKKKSWQNDTRCLTVRDEKSIADALNEYFKGTDYTYVKNPRKMFKNFYMDGPLTEQDEKHMYVPKKGIRSLDMEPDGIIINNRTGKSILVEHKRQEGLTSGRASDKSSGNQYERAGRYLMPGVAKKLRDMCGLDKDMIPFVLIVTGPVTMDIRHIHIIRTMFDTPETENNVFLWRDTDCSEELWKHISSHILPMLG